MAPVSRGYAILSGILIFFFFVVIRPCIKCGIIVWGFATVTVWAFFFKPVGIAVWEHFVKPAGCTICFFVIVAGNLLVILMGNAAIALRRKLIIFSKIELKGGAL